MYPHFFAVFFLLFYIFSSHEITKLCVKFGSRSCLRKKGREKKKTTKKKTKAGQVGKSISSVYIYVAPLLLSNFSTTRKGRKKPSLFFSFPLNMNGIVHMWKACSIFSVCWRV